MVLVERHVLQVFLARKELVSVPLVGCCAKDNALICNRMPNIVEVVVLFALLNSRSVVQVCVESALCGVAKSALT